MGLAIAVFLSIIMLPIITLFIRHYGIATLAVAGRLTPYPNWRSLLVQFLGAWSSVIIARSAQLSDSLNNLYRPFLNAAVNNGQVDQVTATLIELVGAGAVGGLLVVIGVKSAALALKLIRRHSAPEHRNRFWWWCSWLLAAIVPAVLVGLLMWLNWYWPLKQGFEGLYGWVKDGSSNATVQNLTVILKSPNGVLASIYLLCSFGWNLFCSLMDLAGSGLQTRSAAT